MTDPRKRVETAYDPAQAKAVRATAYPYLETATIEGSRAIGCTGVSFVNMAIIIWLEELSELDRAATVALVKSLAVIFDPQTSPAQKDAAERRRQKAIRRLFTALDLMMAEPGGRA